MTSCPLKSRKAGQFRLSFRESTTFRTAWRSEVNSNCRYRFLNCQTQHHVKLCDLETSCEALPPRTAFVTRCRFVVEANGAKVDCPQRQNQSRCCSCRTRRTLPLNVATVTPDRNGVPDHEDNSSHVTNYNTTLSSDSFRNRYRQFEFTSLRQRVTANRYPVVASFRVGTATA